jgi:glycosyltransferase involved in cell wall biosynthesis
MSNQLKVIHISHTDAVGGASRAAYRIHQCLLETGISSEMWVNRSILDDFTIKTSKNKLGQFLQPLKRKIIGKLTTIFLKTKNPIVHSPAVWSSDWVSKINASDADIVQLHWICNEMLSIRDIARISKPVVWTMHDMWGFCGAEHYTDDSRWREGYIKNNRPIHEARFDINRWTWNRKYKKWKDPMYIVCASNWLANCAKDSLLMKTWPVEVIPYPLSSSVWKPFPKNTARELFNLPQDVPLLLFGAEKGGANHRKGFDLLLKSLQILSSRMKINDLELVVFGQSAPEKPINLDYPVHYIGHLHDDLSLRMLYSSADLKVVPSRLEAYGQTASEAQACGVPVVAFDNSGLADIVDHLVTGYLAKSFDVNDLSEGIKWVLSEKVHGELSKNARKKIVEKSNTREVAKQYLKIYKKVLS